MTATKIAELNDHLRRTFTGGRVLMTAAVAALDPSAQIELLERVRSFVDFSADNDPHREHDFGVVTVEGERYFWKIDLYEEPEVKDSNGERVVNRVVTIMLAEEY
jgi:Protein of unknown function (DUF3768)